MNKGPYIEVEPAPSAWDYVVEAARQEGFEAGIKEGLRRQNDAIYQAERAAYKDGRRAVYKEMLSKFGLEDL